MNEKRGAERVLKKLNASIAEGNYYEAHQMYRTLYFRYKAQKKYNDATKLLSEGSFQLLQHFQHGSGCDLAVLLIDVLKTSNTPVDQHWIARLGEIHALMPAACVERPTFVSAALQWSASCPPVVPAPSASDSDAQTDGASSQPSDKAAEVPSACQPVRPGCGHPDLHQTIAHTYWKEENFEQSRAHFLQSVDGPGCARMLIDFHVQKGYPSEVDLFIASTVLQFLCLRKTRTAEDAFFTFTRRHPVVRSEPPFKHPLLNFLWMLLLAVEGGKLGVFTVLVEKYQPTLARDPTFNSYLDKIGQNFFGVPPPVLPKGGGSMLDNLLQSLMGGDDDESPNTSLPTGSSGAAACRVIDHEDLD